MKIILALFISVMFTACATTDNYKIANEAYEKKDYLIAMQKFKVLSEQGNSMATIKVGNMFDAGQGINQNFEEAMKYYKLAAKQGHVLGYIFVGAMYENGQGVAKDLTEAEKWKNLAKKCEAQTFKNCENLYR